MPSSTSASELVTPERAVWLLAAALLAYLLLAEAAMRFILPHHSEIQQRVTRDQDAARRLRPTMPGGARSVLLVGNSLLLQGIDPAQLTKAMGPGYDVVVYPLEATAYLDWYFGLRRLFAEGARPGLVVLCLGTTNMLSDATEGGMFAHFLMRLRDLPAVVRASHLDMMSASEYFFANRSALLEGRVHLHNRLMSMWLPGAQLLASYLPIRQRASVDIGPAGVARVVERLAEMRQLSAHYDASFMYLAPPSPSRADPAEAIRAAALSAGIAVSVPYAPGELPPSAFTDGYHLNPEGAAQFTARVARALQQPAAPRAVSLGREAAGAAPPAAPDGAADPVHHP
jgi:hypothetical protein